KLRSNLSSYGIAIADYNNDGWDDVFVAGWSIVGGVYGTALFRNNGNMTFADVTDTADVGVSGSYPTALWGDFNNDRFVDLFIGGRDSLGFSKIFRNNGDETFTDVTTTSGIDVSISVGGAALGDYDKDGNIDLFVATRRRGDLLYKNISIGGTITFDDVSSAAQIGGPSSTIAMQPTWIDYNHDGWLDLFCVHDGFDVNRLYRNTGTFPFAEISASANLQSVGAGNSMGVTWNDFNNDGWEDVYITRIGEGGFYKNKGDGTFDNISHSSGADTNGMSWGVVFSDFDNDADENIFIINTYQFDLTKSLLFENRNGVFKNIAASANVALTTDGYGAATGDFDNDGDLDIIVANINGNNLVLRNNHTGNNHWVKIHLEGVLTNRYAIGTKTRVVAGGRSQIRIVDGGSSYCSQISPTLQFGLASATLIDSIEIFWTTGLKQYYTNLPIDTTYFFQEDTTLTSIRFHERPFVPPAIRLDQNYPNPFNPTTKFDFGIDTFSGDEAVTLKVFDLLGKEIATIVNDRLYPGIYSATLDASNLPGGIYLYRLTHGYTSITKKFVLMK
ncbi:MAG: VCBS repeat-containing protein, partial [Ignavibacteriae bacterium]|nr:VCBS repeat-containing protein [Ignavibacteriota bacterium]